MKVPFAPVVILALLTWSCLGQDNHANRNPDVGVVVPHSEGLHGYIGFGHDSPPGGSGYNAGMGFYAAVWPLIDQPLADFQIGLPGSWVTPDNSDNKDKPLAPKGTLARTWKERGPTWASVFQTLEGGLGYWAGNHFRYGPPKFSLNATPQCYDYEVGSPGWSFFYSYEALPDDRLGIAQLSNRLLIPPDALPFQGNPKGEFLGYTWMALPFTDPTTGDPPTGDQSWTCFLSAANFKGPLAYYIPETWSKIGKIFHYPFIYGRGLDSRPGEMGGGAMEINTVPRFDGKDARGVTYSKIPALQFPVDTEGRAFLVQDVTYYSKAALPDAFRRWRDGGPFCSGKFDENGAWKPTLKTDTTRFDQGGKRMAGIERSFDTKIFEGNVWGLQWATNDISPKGLFPQYYKHVGDERIAVPAAAVPMETKLLSQEFKLATPGVPYTSPTTGAWTRPGARLGPFTVKLVDGSVVTYHWYRFTDQPAFQQYAWSAEKKAKLQAFVEKIHASWPIDRDYMAPPTRGKLAAFDPALIVTPPKGLEVGYVPIVTRQEAAVASRSAEQALPTPQATDESSARKIPGADYSDTARAVQFDVKGLLNARVVTTWSNGALQTWNRGIDGVWSGLATRRAADGMGSKGRAALPDDATFQANSLHPKVVLHFPNDDVSGNQVRFSDKGMADAYSLYPSDGCFSHLSLFFMSAFGTSEIHVEIAYTDNTKELRMYWIEDWARKVPESETKYFLSSNLAKWGPKNTELEKDGHYLMGIELKPSPTKKISRITMIKPASPTTLTFWGATGYLALREEPNSPEANITGKRIVYADTVTDIEGNVYQAVRLGRQVWTVTNLRTTRFNDGSAIPFDAATVAWKDNTTPLYCYPKDVTDPAVIGRFGLLYNFYAVDTKKLAPAGWHVPSAQEWVEFEQYLIKAGYNWDGSTDGDKIAKAICATTDWNPSIVEGAIGNDLTKNNATGFSAFGTGFRHESGIFEPAGRYTGWWTSTAASSDHAGLVDLHFNQADWSHAHHYRSACGYPVRLIKD